LLTGSAVCGMHYIGQLGISNYRCSYHVANVVGSAIIAIVSSTAALGIFFRWRASWTDSWWRRGICACLLAGAVSGMHWTAAVGTIYRDHNRINMHGTQLSRSQVVIICTVLVCLRSLPRYASLETDSCLGLCRMSHFVDVRYSRWAESQKVDDSCSSACSCLCLL
jgi:NO-binding membrane sensor protein with MHYT domain